MTSIISTESQLRKRVPDYPKMLDKRILSFLDSHCMEFIRYSQIAILAVAGVRFCFHVLAADDQRLRVQADALTFTLDDRDGPALSDLLLPGQAAEASLLFVVPGVGHALRVNGMAEYSGYPGSLSFRVQQAYLHCARAIARAKLWQAVEPSADWRNDPPRTLSGFLAASPYVLLKTEDGQGHTEISPRGDAPGFVRTIGGQQLFLPERPGNKIAKSLRNILATGRAGLLGFIAGSPHICQISGRAWVSDEAALLDGSIEQGKRPKLGIIFSDVEWRIDTSDVLLHRSLWDIRDHVDKNKLTPFPKALAEHMNGTGLLGKATGQVVKAVVRHDMKHLY
ncbi:pyridoxamine 5'-phosphate oxidase family protein [Marinobacter zhejiangensis]|uniref:Uncharacterized protein n=1 Tax=Marinobacter zhejiangensis TaxID=488535 RepID=A0A1I4LZV1_9GAMM|nr:pyridoxamine 5'-phosphate oxidase family protein [Marinobacter zhejiangensis]SFL96480.1 hypothetical protein SAMN04487963_0767 [Marinobacter zhejiangensis]